MRNKEDNISKKSISSPKDWYSLQIKDVISFSGGSQPPKSTFISEKKPGYIRLIQIRDYKSDDFMTFIPEVLANKKCNAKDVMIGRYGPPIFQILKGIEGAYNVALIKAIPSEQIIKGFMYYFLKQKTLFKHIELLSRRSSGQTGVDIVALNGYPIVLPPVSEQKVIVTALSDMDGLIESLEEVIDKKKKIKQGTMQQLLTGKKRLPGFTGEWEKEELGNITNIRRGSIISRANTKEGNVAVIAGGKQPAYYHNESNRGGDTITVSASGANAGYVSFYSEPIFASDCSTIEAMKDHSIMFLYYTLKLKQNDIYYMQTGGAQPHVHPSDLKPILIKMPRYEEQQAIATILSDMDTEIELLEEKLDKYDQMKEGMMQQLLTGRVRLV